MKLLLDTHSFLWFVNGDMQLSVQARTLIEDLSNERFLSTASLWEMAIKHSTGKLQFSRPFDEFLSEQLSQNDVQITPITFQHTVVVASLPFHHRDPFDRMIIAQSIIEGMPIISIDGKLDAYGVSRLW